MERHKPDQVFAKTGELDQAAIEWAKKVAADPTIDPVLALYGPANVGAVSERFDKELNDVRISMRKQRFLSTQYIAANRHTLFSSKSPKHISKEKFRVLMCVASFRCVRVVASNSRAGI